MSTEHTKPMNLKEAFVTDTKIIHLNSIRSSLTDMKKQIDDMKKQIASIESNIEQVYNVLINHTNIINKIKVAITDEQ